MTTAVLAEPEQVALPLVRYDEPLFEIIDGQQVELQPMSYYAVRVASHLHEKLIAFKLANDIGSPVVEALFRLPLEKDRNRRPDVAFVSYKRWPKTKPSKPTDNAWSVVPNLAVEVVSPRELADEVMEKISEYFQAGVELVWVVYPIQRVIHVYESPTNIRGFTALDELDGGTVLPGFSLKVGAFFAELPVEPLPEEP